MAATIPNAGEIIEEQFVLALKDSAEKFLNPANMFLPNPSEMGYGVNPESIHTKLLATLQLIAADPQSFKQEALGLFQKHSMNLFDFYQNYVNGNPDQTFDTLSQQYSGKGLLAAAVGGGFNQGFAEGTPEQGNRMIDYLAKILRTELFS
jgi:hypothetical protein